MARGDAELGEDVAQVVLDGAGTQEQAGADFRIGQAVAGQAGNLCFTRGQLAGDREDASSVEAEGICEYGDPYSGSTRITCVGRTQAGDFIGIFVSDGKAPTVQQF